MRILFVYTEINVKFGIYGFQHGIAAISAYLKLKGYNDIQLCYLSSIYNPSSFYKILRTFQPHVVGIYCTHYQISFIKKILSGINSSSVFIICGGPHSTLNPGIISEIPRLDAVCIGEGEEPLLEIIRDLEQDRRPTSVRNLWIRSGKEIIKNSCRHFLEKLDSLPFVDRDIFSKSKFYRRIGLTGISYRNCFRISRGCPYQCSFCSNRNISLSQPGKYLRFRSVDKVLEEIRQVVERYRPQVLYFEDDSFTTNEIFINEFCEKYARYVRLPFEFSSHISLNTIPLLKRLRQAGGRRVSFGIETGNERLRSEILKKEFSNREIIEVLQEAKQLGYQTETFLMIGLPDETLESFGDTIRIIRKIQPDLCLLSVYFPFQGTDLYDYCVKKEFIKPDFIIPDNFSFRRHSLLNMPQFPTKKILRQVRRFGIDVYRGYSFKKAILFWIYESYLGDVLLRLMSFHKRLFRRLAFGNITSLKD